MYGGVGGGVAWYSLLLRLPSPARLFARPQWPGSPNLGSRVTMRGPGLASYLGGPLFLGRASHPRASLLPSMGKGAGVRGRERAKERARRPTDCPGASSISRRRRDARSRCHCQSEAAGRGDHFAVLTSLVLSGQRAVPGLAPRPAPDHGDRVGGGVRRLQAVLQQGRPRPHQQAHHPPAPEIGLEPGP